MNQPNDGIGPLLTGSEVARKLRISCSYVYALIRRGEMPALRVGRSVRVRREDLDAFINDHLNGGTVK